MRAVSAGYLDRITRSHGVTTRITLLDSNMLPLEEFTSEGGYAISGSVSMDRTRSPERTCQLSLVNPKGVLTPRFLAPSFYLNVHFRIERGVVFPDGSTEYALLGTFMVDQPNAGFDGGGAQMYLRGQDRWKLGTKAKLRQPLTFPVGMPVAAAIRALAESAGYGASDEVYELFDSGRVLGVATTFDAFTSQQEAMLKLATDHALWLRMTPEGRMRCTPKLTLQDLSAPVFDYEPGEQSTLVSVTKDIGDDELYNATIVIGESTGNPTVVAEARDLNPASPAYNPLPPAIGPIGDRVFEPHRSADITTQAQAQLVADQLLIEHSMVEEAHQVQAIVNAALEPGDTISLVVPEAGTSGVFLIDSIELPLAEGEDDEMAFYVKALRSLT